LARSQDDLYIFIDDPNLYIEGKFVIGEYEKIGIFDLKEDKYILSNPASIMSRYLVF
jgi:hypothetical protein